MNFQGVLHHSSQDPIDDVLGTLYGKYGRFVLKVGESVPLGECRLVVGAVAYSIHITQVSGDPSKPLLYEFTVADTVHLS